MAQIDLIKTFSNEDAETFNKISKGYSMGRADTKNDLAKECAYLLASGMGKKKALEHLLKILNKE